jgi:SAM-dependent methyltransferase
MARPVAARPVTKAGYVFGQNVDDAERERLSRLEDSFDAYTVQRLDRIGIGPGWHCLEVGAGHGSVARMLSDRVGASGSVVATDIDLRFLTDLPANVEARRHDIQTSDLGEALYDFIHCRAMLMWLREPATALERMIGALKPGGWLLAEEFDWDRTVGQAPRAHWANDTCMRSSSATKPRGFATPTSAARLPPASRPPASRISQASSRQRLEREALPRSK